MTKKKKNQSPTPESILSLPDDLILSCLARVSRLYYPSLSLVSKKFRSLLASPELYETRSFLRRTESCLYVCLEFYSDNNPRWFTLCGNLLVPIPSHCSRPLSQWSCLVALGSSIYRIGGHIDPSTSVSILDCRSHTWREAPSLMVGRFCPSASVVDEKICVVGGCQDSSIEVFDSKTQTWDHVPSPDPTWELYWGCVTKSAYVEEIALERRKTYEIWGKVEFLDSVLPLPVTNSCELVKVLAVTL